ncbi:MAG: hypothetical protein IJD13_00365 [Oscillospiraceae bacterium]|nr:hypothetical protein [Oscillospiraceae bacterium]
MRKIFAVLFMLSVLLSSCGEKQTASSEISSGASSENTSETSSGIHSEISSEPESEPSSEISSEPESEPSSDISSEPESEPSSEISSEPESEPSAGSDDQDETCAGAASECLEHHFLYHSVSGRLINHVGREAVEEWQKTLPAERDAFNRNHMDAFTIRDFIEYFDISKEIFTELERGGLGADFLAEFDGVTVCSLDQIDALYSGDPAKVNEAFCGELAFVHEGELWSVYRLAESTAREVLASGVPIGELKPLIERLETDYAPFSTVMKKLALDARVTLESAISIDNYYSCYAHHGLFHSVDSELILHIGGYEVLEAKEKGLTAGYVYGNEPMAEVDTLSALITDFDIGRETFASLAHGYSDDQIDALYSGDPAKVNEAFCGELAFVHEGELWSVYRLAEMDDLSGLPREKIEALLERAAGDYPGNVKAMADKIRFTLG